LAAALGTFFELRDTPGLTKRPSTSELLDWIKLLLAEDIRPSAARGDLKTSLPPLYGALLKNEQDLHLFEKLVFPAPARGALSPGPCSARFWSSCAAPASR